MLLVPIVVNTIIFEDDYFLKGVITRCVISCGITATSWIGHLKFEADVKFQTVNGMLFALQ